MLFLYTTSRMAQNYKIVLVGDAGSGKTTFLNRIRTGEFEKKYIATQGVDVIPLTFNTNYGVIVFKVWDTAGQEKFGGLREKYYQNADAAIAMYDLTKKSQNNILQWVDNVRNVLPDIPFIICGNKCDITDRPSSGLYMSQEIANASYFHISAKSNYNFDKPWLELARKLTGHEDLIFIDMPEIKPPKVELEIPKLMLSLPTPTYKYVNMISLPDGGVMKVTHEYYPNTDILRY